MRPERTQRARRYWAAIFFILLGTLSGAWHSRTTDHGKSDVVVGAVRGVVAPPASALAKTSRWLSDQTGWLFHGRTVARENQELKARVAELEGENAGLREAQIKFDQTRGDAGFLRAQKTPPLAADIIARRPDPKFDTLIIACGSSDGVAVNNVIATRDGLVGKVYEVTPGTASVLMLTDQNSGAGARVQRAGSRATGVCKGDNTPLLSLIYLPSNADIKAGDVIVTSGIGGIYPPGLVIGTVKDVKTDAGNALKIGRIVPRVDFDRLEQVYVLR